MAENLNENQKLAVKYIIKAHPIPYLLFGPPGTGKTRTLVAAIQQIVKTTKKFVLLCAGSNAACDTITERLISVLCEDEIFRMHAKSVKPTNIPAKIKLVSNFKDDELKFPSLEYLYGKRVKVCTLSIAGCLTRAREVDSKFDSGHFDYVIIDEAASVPEPVSLIPIAGE